MKKCFAKLARAAFSKIKKNERMIEILGFQGKVHFMIILQLRCWFLHLEKFNVFYRKTLLYALEIIQKLDSLKVVNI